MAVLVCLLWVSAILALQYTRQIPKKPKAGAPTDSKTLVEVGANPASTDDASPQNANQHRDVTVQTLDPSVQATVQRTANEHPIEPALRIAREG